MDSEKYEELKVIGKGGQGTVYKVRKKSKRGIYALKEIDLSKIVDNEKKKEVDKEIDKEIKLLQSLEHPRIVEVRSVDKNENTINIEMDYIEGPTLQQAINEGFSTYEDGVNIMLEVLDPMIYLHNQHVAHLDIKPQNIILDGNNRPTLVDFGSSLLMHSDASYYGR